MALETVHTLVPREYPVDWHGVIKSALQRVEKAFSVSPKLNELLRPYFYLLEPGDGGFYQYLLVADPRLPSLILEKEDGVVTGLEAAIRGLCIGIPTVLKQLEPDGQGHDYNHLAAAFYKHRNLFSNGENCFVVTLSHNDWFDVDTDPTSDHFPQPAVFFMLKGDMYFAYISHSLVIVAESKPRLDLYAHILLGGVPK